MMEQDHIHIHVKPRRRRRGLVLTAAGSKASDSERLSESIIGIRTFSRMVSVKLLSTSGTPMDPEVGTSLFLGLFLARPFADPDSLAPVLFPAWLLPSRCGWLLSV